MQFGWVPNAFRWHNSDSCTHIHNQLIEAQGEVQDYKNICDELAAADQKNQQTREQTCMRIQELERQLQDSQNKQSTLQQEVQKLNGVVCCSEYFHVLHISTVIFDLTVSI